MDQNKQQVHYIFLNEVHDLIVKLDIQRILDIPVSMSNSFFLSLLSSYANWSLFSHAHITQIFNIIFILFT